MTPVFGNVCYVLFTITSYTLFCFIGCIFLLGLVLKLFLNLKSKLYRSNRNMIGKTVLITGANSGIGKAVAYDLAERNARVIMACRNVTKATVVADDIKCSTGNYNVIVKYLDLTSFESVRNCAQDVIDNEERLDVLVINAGIGVDPGTSIAEDGYETIMQTNYLGHFLLTMLLVDLLKKSAPSRIINVTSIAYRFANLDSENLSLNNEYPDLQNYANSNLAKILFARELTLMLLDSGVTVNTVCLDLVNTNLFSYSTDLFPTVLAYLTFIFGQTQKEGAQTIIKLAVDPSLEKTTGQLFKYCKKVEFAKNAKDRILSQKLLQLSEQIAGVSFYDF